MCVGWPKLQIVRSGLEIDIVVLKNKFQLGGKFRFEILDAEWRIGIFTPELKLQLTPCDFYWLVQDVHFVRQPDINVDGYG